MEHLRRSRGIDDLHVVVGTELQEAFDARARMLWSLTLVSVRQQHHQTSRTLPLRFARGEELIDEHLRAVDEVAKLRFPNHQHARVTERVAVFETNHRALGERRVVHTKTRLFRSNRVERRESIVGLLACHDAVTMAECSALDILSREAHGVAFDQECSVREQFAHRPIDMTRSNRVAARFEQTRDSLVRGDGLGIRAQLLGDRIEGLECNTSLNGFVRILRTESRPHRTKRIDHRVERL